MESGTGELAASQILTPDQRLRVFVSSTLQELAAEREAASEAIGALRLTPVLFELGARPHPPQALYRAYLEQSHVFVGIYWRSYGWVAPAADISGIEDEYRLSSGKPRLVYVKEPADEREPRLSAFLDSLRSEAGVSYKRFESPDELRELIAQDLALLMTERFHPTEASPGFSRMRTPPAQSTSFVGRTEELDAIARSFTEGVRLLTLTGPGGIGKTRLALEAASRLRDAFPDGVAFVALDGLESHELVTPAVSSALGIRDGGPEPLDGITAHLENRRLLLLLDNFEHVIGAAAFVSRLLEATPQLTVLVTSRELLHVRGEYELHVAPLAPETEAAVLFAERAATALHGFEPRAEDLTVVGEICRRLDGVPLAIELAAPRLRVLTPEQLLDSLRERLELVGPRDAPARQQTLQAAIAWSYELLGHDERRLFEWLSAFRGSFTLESAAAASATQASELVQPLGSLLDKSMIYRLPGPEPTPTRFGMLSMLRDFGHERLVGSVEHDQVFERLTSFYLDFAAEAELGIRSRAQRRWKRLIDLEVDTLRAELAWLAEHGRGDDLVTLLRALWLWYWLSGQLVEGRDWVRRTLPFEQRLAADQRAWLVCLDGLFAFFQLDLEPAAERLAQARSLFEETSDRLGFATVLAIAGFAAGAVSGEAAALEQLNEAHAAFVELDDAWGRAGTLGTICRIRSIFGRYESAGDLFEENLTAAERVGDDLLIALALTNLADYSFAVGEPAASRRYIDRALALLDATGIRYSAPDLLEALARVEGHTGAHARAAELVGAAENLRQTMHVPLWGPIAERHADVVQRLRRELGTEAFDDLRARGRTTSLSHWLQSPARKPGETAPDVKLPTDRP